MCDRLAYWLSTRWRKRQKGKRMLMVLVMLLAVSAASVDHNDAFGPDLCVVQTPLVERHFQAWSSGEPVTTRGCRSASRPNLTSLAASTTGAKTNAHEVHMIRLLKGAGLSGDVTLEIDASGRRNTGARLVLILDAGDAIVNWVVRSAPGSGRDGQSLGEPHIVVTGNSELNRVDFKATVANRPGENRQALLRFAERRYKAIHSLSQVEGMASRLLLTLSTPASSTLTVSTGANGLGCDYDSLSISPVLKAWNDELQSVEGCFHAQQAGIYPKDVHIIDLDNSGPGSVGVSGSVHIHLTSDYGSEEGPRNVALVLKSSRPLRSWIVSSSPVLSGNLLIMAEHSVENGGISSRQQLDIRPDQIIPEAFAVLILTVTAELDPPISYVKTSTATSRIELVISEKKKIARGENQPRPQQQQLHGNGKQPAAPQEAASGAASASASHSSPSMEMGVRSLDRGNGNVHPSKISPNRGGLTWTLQQAVRVQCSAMQLTASLPAPLADALGVTGLYLSDRGCSGRRNATHWSITSRVTSCGSTLRIGEKLTTYSNLVYVQVAGQQHDSVDDEDVEDGSGSENLQSSTGVRQVPIPIQCYSHPPGKSSGSSSFKQSLAGDQEEDDEDNIMDTVEDLPVGQWTSPYHMEIFRNKEWTSPITVSTGSATAASVDSSKAQVVFDETLHVRTWIDGVAYIKIVTEKCWVSNSSDSDWPARLVLIRNTCPADLTVRIREPSAASSQTESSGGFSFQVSSDYADMGQLYIHCKLGLCTNDPVKAQGNLKMCVDPAQYCTGRHVLKSFLDESVSTAQQILVRGPLHMVSKLAPGHSKSGRFGDSVSTSTSSSDGTDDSPSTQVIIVGVSTEVTVGIALASFVIGVGLTAILWCIHTRTDPYRRVLNRKSRSNRSSSSGVNNRCSGVKCSPMIRVRSSTADPRASCAFMQDGSPAGQLQQQQQQQQQLMTSSVDHEVDPDCATPPPSLAPQHSSSQYQFSYDYDVSSSQSHSSSGQSSREESSPTPNSQTPMTVSC